MESRDKRFPVTLTVCARESNYERSRGMLEGLGHARVAEAFRTAVDGFAFYVPEVGLNGGCGFCSIEAVHRLEIVVNWK
ncbi:hypothetical protein TNIN_215941 [Trichonephila inaurata madagascariensis]|uniref:Uncharacterized protein n=1 Tax=Trichonephila inaurata madagascariensis TaxID=2747483 RepID=A0A8X6Y5U9_9ARAC|nr:hypothetical protein TNIN_215941 [Trichonephila inaurata madagascariensis]